MGDFLQQVGFGGGKVGGLAFATDLEDLPDEGVQVPFRHGFDG